MGLQASPSTKANFLAVITLLGIVVGLGLVWHGSSREALTHGPAALAASPEGELFIEGGGRILHVDRNAELLHSASYAELGLDGPVVQLVLLDGDLLLLDMGGNRVRRCDTSLRQCDPFFPQGEAGPNDLLSMAAAPEAQRLYLATSSPHRIYVFDFNGKVLYRLRVPDGLEYVNHMEWLGGDRLLVVDSDQHRVIELEDLGGGKVRLVGTIDAENELGRAGRKWPMEAVRESDGETWVINGNGFLRHGDLILYDAEGEARQRIMLESGVDPSGLTAYPGGVLVSDAANRELLLVGRSDYAVTPFGGDSLRSALRVMAEEEAYWRQIYRLGVGVIVLFLSLGFVAAYLDWKARQALQEQSKANRSAGVDEAFAIPDWVKARLRPDAQGVYWLKIVPLWLWIYRVIFLLIPVVLIAEYFLIGEFVAETVGPWFLLYGAMVVLVSGLTLWLTYIALPRIRFGNDGSHFHLIDFRGRRAKARPERFIRTHQRLIIGKVGVPISQHPIHFYDKEIYKALIEPMLESVPRSNELLVYWGYLREGDPVTWLGTLAFLGLLLIPVFM